LKDQFGEGFAKRQANSEGKEQATPGADLVVESSQQVYYVRSSCVGTMKVLCSINMSLSSEVCSFMFFKTNLMSNFRKTI